MMRTLCTGLAALGLATTTAEGGLALPQMQAPDFVQQVHSVYDAEATLERRGYYDVRLERASLPYSFNACKRGIRYHIHVNYYGDLVQVDPVGPCGTYGYEYYGDRRHYDDDSSYRRYRRPRYYE